MRKSLVSKIIALAAATLLIVCVVQNYDEIKTKFHIGEEPDDQLGEVVSLDNNIGEFLRQEEAKNQNNHTESTSNTSTSSTNNDRTTTTSMDTSPSSTNSTSGQTKNTTSTNSIEVGTNNFSPFTLSTKDVNFKIKNYYCSDDLPKGINPNQVSYSSRQIDEKRKLKDGYFHLIIDAEISNRTNKKFEYLINSFSGLYVDKNDNILWPIVELVYFTQQRGTIDSVDSFHYVFEKNETIQATLILVLNKETLLENNVYFLVNNSGAVPFDEDVAIKKVEIDKEYLK